jgi:hypothetical protein
MSDLSPRLAALGASLEQAAAADLAAARRPRRARSRRRLALGAAIAVVAIPGAALAASALIGSDDVERSIPAGTLSLAGTEPTCTVVRAGVEFDCRLTHAPAPEVADWKGTVEPTVDATKHVNGGCRSQTSDGRHWRCYIGQEAVRQQIIGAGLLGQDAPQPGAG